MTDREQFQKLTDSLITAASVRIRQNGDNGEWAIGKIAMRSESTMLIHLADGYMVRSGGGLVGGVIPLVIEYETCEIAGILNESFYTVEVLDTKST